MKVLSRRLKPQRGTSAPQSRKPGGRVIAGRTVASSPIPPLGFDGRTGLTIVEILVTISIISILVALLIPAVQAARESSRRAQCSSNLRQIGIAIQNFESAKRTFPPGSFQYALLPYMDQKSLFDAGQSGGPVSGQINWGEVSAYPAPFYGCPSDGGNSANLGTNYLGNSGSDFMGRDNNGLFCFDKIIRPADVTKGLSNTAAVGEGLVTTSPPTRLRTAWGFFPPVENIDDLPAACEALPLNPSARGYPAGLPRGVPWCGAMYQPSCYNHILPPNRPSCMNSLSAMIAVLTSNSLHSGGVNLLYADGRVDFTNEGIDRDVWRVLGARATSRSD